MVRMTSNAVSEVYETGTGQWDAEVTAVLAGSLTRQRYVPAVGCCWVAVVVCV